MTTIVLAQVSYQIDNYIKFTILIVLLFFIVSIIVAYRVLTLKGRSGLKDMIGSILEETVEIPEEQSEKGEPSNELPEKNESEPDVMNPDIPITEQPAADKENKNKEMPSVVEEETENELKKGCSKPKHIGYNPINLFAQTEPLNYPYVVMPNKADCVIKFPRKGRIGRKGYKEDAFYDYLKKYFSNNFKLYNDRFVLSKNNTYCYEPDFTLTNEENGINLFIDIEIDEPYEGVNDIYKRNVTHCQYFDTNRNNEFASRGWIVIRFAEIQVHQNPNGCCRFIADVIRSICSDFQYPANLLSANIIKPVRQWTKELARQWSIQKYREQYLGLDYFGSTINSIPSIPPKPTEEEIEVEGEVVDERSITTPKIAVVTLSNRDLINRAIDFSKYIAFKYKDKRTIVKPIEYKDSILTAFCYVKNQELSFNIAEMTDIHMKENYYTHRFKSPNLGTQKVADIMNVVIPNQMFVRMKYTRAAWTAMSKDPSTGKVIENSIEAEESIRTVSNIKLDSDGWGDNYIETYCHKREEKRTFRFDRISELELLDL